MSGEKSKGSGDKPEYVSKVERQQKYVEALEHSITDVEALKAAGIVRRTLERWMKEPEFVLKYRDAVQARGNNLEEGMFAVLEWGIQPDRYQQILRYHSLLMFALRGLKPEKYAERTLLAYGQAQDDLKSLLNMDDTPAEKKNTTTSVPAKGPKKGEEGDWLEKLLASAVSDDN